MFDLLFLFLLDQSIMALRIGLNETTIQQPEERLMRPIGVLAEARFACGTAANFAPRNKLLRTGLQIVAYVFFVRIHYGQDAFLRGLRPLKSEADSTPSVKAG